jgi:acetyl-CoA carboxylase carboxyltransferase component
VTYSGAPTPVFGRRSDTVDASLRDFDGRQVAWFSLEGGKHRGAIGTAEGDAIARTAKLAVELGIPIVGRVSSSGADVTEGLSALHAWGRIAKHLADASGVVPVVLVLVGPAVSGPALLLGIADHVIMTAESYAYVSGPDVVLQITGQDITPDRLGGAAVHERESGVAAIVADDEDGAMAALAHLLEYLPSNHLEDPPLFDIDDPIDRPCDIAAAAVPARATASYDVRTVLRDVLDEHSFLELRAKYAPNLVTGLGRVGGRPVGIIANQPMFRAGTLDIEASRKAARFVQWCDAFNFPLLTFVDTPGFEPGRDLEWRGMIRYGAQLVHAYAEATVPRICIVMRKSYGGAYIVMDSKNLGNDWCIAWPTAEIAVMGAPGAVQILHRSKLAEIADPEARRAKQLALEEEYTQRFANPYVAAERGFVDMVVTASETRQIVADALLRLSTKREQTPGRRHSNTPL